MPAIADNSILHGQAGCWGEDSDLKKNLTGKNHSLVCWYRLSSIKKQRGKKLVFLTWKQVRLWSYDKLQKYRKLKVNFDSITMSLKFI